MRCRLPSATVFHEQGIQAAGVIAVECRSRSVQGGGQHEQRASSGSGASTDVNMALTKRLCSGSSHS